MTDGATDKDFHTDKGISYPRNTASIVFIKLQSLNILIEEKLGWFC